MANLKYNHTHTHTNTHTNTLCNWSIFNKLALKWTVCLAYKSIGKIKCQILVIYNCSLVYLQLSLSVSLSLWTGTHTTTICLLSCFLAKLWTAVGIAWAELKEKRTHTHTRVYSVLKLCCLTHAHWRARVYHLAWYRSVVSFSLFCKLSDVYTYAYIHMYAPASCVCVCVRV